MALEEAGWRQNSCDRIILFIKLALRHEKHFKLKEVSIMAKNEKDNQKEKGKLSVSRRDFLVAGSAMIAGGALSASSIAAAAQRSGSPGSSSRRQVVFGGVEELTPDGMTKYGKYLTSEIVCSSKYPQITAPAAKYDGCRGGGENAINL